MKSNKVVFAFHNVSNNFNLGLNNLSISRFKKYLQYLISNYNEYEICFDDAYEDIYKNVFPLQVPLNKTIFPITNFIGKMNDWDINFFINRKKHININQIINLHKNGWNIGSHGHYHISYKKLTNNEILDDLITSKNILENTINAEVDIFTPPFGYIHRDHLALIIKAGYKKIYLNNQYLSSIKRSNEIKIFRRINIYSIDSLNSIKARFLDHNPYNKVENFIHNFSNATVYFKKR